VILVLSLYYVDLVKNVLHDSTVRFCHEGEINIRHVV
jgi:hypothetical protein